MLAADHVQPLPVVTTTGNDPPVASAATVVPVYSAYVQVGWLGELHSPTPSIRLTIPETAVAFKRRRRMATTPVMATLERPESCRRKTTALIRNPHSGGRDAAPLYAAHRLGSPRHILTLLDGRGKFPPKVP